MKRLLTIPMTILGTFAIGLILTTPAQCQGDFCNTCDQQSVEVFNNTPGDDCAKVTASASFCLNQCPTCKFCASRIRVANYLCQ